MATAWTSSEPDVSNILSRWNVPVVTAPVDLHNDVAVPPVPFVEGRSPFLTSSSSSHLPSSPPPIAGVTSFASIEKPPDTHAKFLELRVNLLRREPLIRMSSAPTIAEQLADALQRLHASESRNASLEQQLVTAERTIQTVNSEREQLKENVRVLQQELERVVSQLTLVQQYALSSGSSAVPVQQQQQQLNVSDSTLTSPGSAPLRAPSTRSSLTSPPARSPRLRPS